MWDTPSAIIGIFIGLTLSLIIFWISYNNRIFIFTTCPKVLNICKKDDYYNDPSDAIAEGSDPNDILFLDSNGQLYYHRVPNRHCMPGRRQNVYIPRPKYCLFESIDGQTVKASNLSFDSSNYVSVDKINGEYIDIVSPKDCIPQSNTGNILLDTGKPLVEWS